MIIKILTISAALSLVLSPALVISQDDEKIEARVNDAILTTSELNNMLKPVYRQYEQTSRGEELRLRMLSARRSAIDGWIDNQLILQEAKGMVGEGFQIDQIEIKKRFDKARSGFETREEFDRALRMEGLDEAEYRNNLEDQYTVQALRYQKVGGFINISPEDIMNYYRNHDDKYRDGEMVRVSHILLPSSDDSGEDESVRQQAEKILEELRTGTDFAILARKYSQGPRAEQGGDLGYYNKDQMRPKLDEAAFSLEVGKNSGVIKTDLGYHIIKCTGKKEAYQKPLEDHWEEIENQLYQEEYQRRYDKWIEELRSRAYIDS